MQARNPSEIRQKIQNLIKLVNAYKNKYGNSPTYRRALFALVDLVEEYMKLDPAEHIFDVEFEGEKRTHSPKSK